MINLSRNYVGSFPDEAPPKIVPNQTTRNLPGRTITFTTHRSTDRNEATTYFPFRLQVFLDKQLEHRTGLIRSNPSTALDPFHPDCPPRAAAADQAYMGRAWTCLNHPRVSNDVEQCSGSVRGPLPLRLIIECIQVGYAYGHYSRRLKMGWLAGGS